MKEYNIAIIGCGSMGKTHAYAAASIPFFYADCGFKPVLHTLVSSDKNNARRYGFLNYSPDFYSILNDKSIDVVDICTPNMQHYEQAKAALNAGKHVFCEKPLAVTVEQARELEQIANERGLITQINFQNRFWPVAIRAKELISEGRLGQILSFRAAFLHSSSLDKNRPYAWRYAPVSQGGGVLIDLGSHLFDMLNYLLGEIGDIVTMTKTLHTERSAGGVTNPVTSDDAAFMIARLKCGATGTIEATKLASGISDSIKIEIHGTHGAIKFDLSAPNTLQFFDATEQGGAYGGMQGFKSIDCMQKYPHPCTLHNGANITGGVRAHIHSYFSFLQAVHTGSPASPSFTDGVYVQKVIEKANKNRR